MSSSRSAAETVAHIIELRQAGEFDKAASFYDEQVAFVVQPGMVWRGRARAREALQAMSTMFDRFEIVRREVVEAEGLALHQASWRAWDTAADGPHDHEGFTADVMRRDADGVWRFVVDNPWGALIVAG